MNACAPPKPRHFTPLPTGHAYRIPKFDEVHANSELRKQTAKGGDWHFVRFPVRFDSLRMRRMFQTVEGTAAFGVYCILAQIAANGRPERGLIANRDGALTLDDVSLITSLPRPHLDRAVSALLACGWLDTVDIASAAPSATPATPRDETGDPQAPAATPHTATLREETSQPAHADGTGTATHRPSNPPPPPDPESQSQPHGNGNTTPPPHIGLVGNSSKPGGAGGGSVAGLLLRIGVQPKARREIVAAGKTGPEVVAAWAAAQADEQVKEPAAVLRHRLISADVRPAKLTTKGLMAAIRAGVVVCVDGVSIDDAGAVKHNSSGVTYRRQMLAPADRIKKHELEVA